MMNLLINLRTIPAWIFSSTLLLVGCATLNQEPAVAPVVKSQSAPESGIRQVSFEDTEVRQADIEPVEIEEESWWDVFNPLKVTDKALETTGQNQQNQAKAKQLFAQGESLYGQAFQATGSKKKNLLQQAASRFERAAKYYKESNIEENSLMMTGECYYFLDDYNKATESYNQLIIKYPNTRHLDTVGIRRFKLAQFWLTKYKESPTWPIVPNLTDDKFPLFDRYGHAIKQFDLIRLDDPTGKLADDATLAAASAHFKEGRYADADRFFTDLRDNFPTSQHQFTAHFLGLYCKLRIYQGPEYDGSPVTDAERLAKQIERQFPEQARENREALEKANKEIRARKAERRWHLAKYYDNRGDSGGARYYYNLIVEEFPNSNMAQAAASRIEEIKDDPIRAPQQAKWLVDLIVPEDDNLPKISKQPLGDSTQLR